MPIVPINQWSFLRLALAEYLAFKDPPLDRMEVRMRFPSGAEEKLAEIILAGQTFTPETLLARVVEDLEHHTRFLEPMPRALVRVFPMGRGGARYGKSGSDQFSVNTDDADRTSDPAQSLALPSSDILSHRLQTGHFDKFEGGVLATLLHHSHLQNAQMMDKVLAFCAGDRAEMQGTIRALSNDVKTASDKAVDALLAQRQAQQDADAARNKTALAEKDTTIRHELMKQFGGNVNSLLSLLMTKALGLPPNDPALLKAYMAGIARQSPETAKEIMGMAMSSGAFSIADMKGPLLAWAKENPDDAMAFGMEMAASLEVDGRVKLSQIEAQKK